MKSSLFSYLSCILDLIVPWIFVISITPVNASEWIQVNTEGFDPDWERAQHNYGVFDDSFAVYDGRLYAGTDNPFNGSEIWAYSGDGSTNWTKVSGESIPEKSIFYGGEATEFLAVYDEYLYAGTVFGVNAPFKKSGQLWRSNIPEDVNSWIKVFDYEAWLSNPAGGDTGDLLSIIKFNGYLYLSASAVESGNRNAQIFRSADGVNWEKVFGGDASNGLTDQNAFSAYAFEIFDNELYVSITNNNDGAEIWKTYNGIEWMQANIDGMAADAYQKDRDVIRQLIAYDGYLYAVLKNYHDNDWVEVWRSKNGTDWVQAGGIGLGDPVNNTDGRGVAVYNGCLYVGTGGTCSQRARVYQSCDGETFVEITNGQLGDANNHGVMAMKKYENYLYAGTFRFISGGIGGAEVWRYTNDTDNDGIPDDRDSCPNSNLEPIIMIGSCDTGVQNQVLENGCTMSDLIAGCSANTKNQFALLKCVNQLTQQWKSYGIGLKEKWAILKCAFNAQ
jgi:hypothetical protein